MNKISVRNHGYLDFVTVVLFALSPTLFDFPSIATTLAYLLAVVHLVLTLATDFPFGVIKIIPFPIHGWIERIVGPLLIVVPFILGFSEQFGARNFYIVIGVVIVIVGLLTDYHATDGDRLIESK
ncbi:MAG: SPW repeat domain-containing protein [Methylococcales bacterium]